MNLTPLMQSLVLHFGEMGSRWGISRTVGQIYGLLVVTETPLNADQIGDMLNFSRSNVSMGLKELQAWELIRPQHQPGDRKEYFIAAEDAWDIACTLVEQRRKREIDPTLSLLRKLLMETPANSEEEYAQQRMQDMHNLLELATQLTADIQRLNSKDLNKLIKLGSGISKVLDIRNIINSQ